MRVFNDCFAHEREDFNAGVSGPGTFRRIIRVISSRFNHGDGNASCNGLQRFGGVDW